MPQLSTCHFPLSTFCPGARLYHSTASVWLSVDPLSDKYPSVSPYVYCANNPVRLVDPDGREIWIVGEDGNRYRYSLGKLYAENGDEFCFSETSYEGKCANAISVLKETETGANLIASFEDTDNDITIQSASVKQDDSKGTSTFDPGTDIIFWNENGASLFTTRGREANAIMDLGHEFSHAYDYCVGFNYEKGNFEGLNTEEWMAIYRENCIRDESNLPLRISYGSNSTPDYWNHNIRNYSPRSPLTIFKETPYFPEGYLR